MQSFRGIHSLLPEVPPSTRLRRWPRAFGLLPAVYGRQFSSRGANGSSHGIRSRPPQYGFGRNVSRTGKGFKFDLRPSCPLLQNGMRDVTPKGQ